MYAEQIKEEISKRILIQETGSELTQKVKQKEEKVSSDMVVLPTYRTHKLKEVSEKDIEKEMKLT